MKYDYIHSSIDQDRKAAQEVWERVEKNRSESKQTGGEEGQREEGGGSDEEKATAARLMQKNYCAHVGRRTAEGRNLTTSKRFDDGLQQRKLKAAGKEQMDGKNDATSRWHRSAVYAGQLTDGQKNNSDLMQQPSEEEEMKALARNDKEREEIKAERDVAKRMEPQYWLEIVDSKHRYASNLKYYHQKWNDTDTSENFFHWLDEGDGKHLELEECPRKRLDEERITYLTAEQRETYRVIVNESGLLVWAKNGEPLDTSKYHEDLGPEKGGVVEISEERFKEKQEEDKDKIRKAKEAEGSSASSSDFGSSSSSSSDDEVADEIRAGSKAYGDKGGTAGEGKGIRQFKKSLNIWDRAFCHHGVNRWLYVSDLTNGLFVSIKKTGGFQHSSFLFGARVTSAGLIKASEGKLTSLSPLSGHYRAGTMHFKAFVRGLEEQKVDMTHVSISKSVMTIRGIEKYGKFNKSKKALTSRIKSTFTGHKTPQSEEEDEEEAKREKISSQERGARSSGQVRKDGYDSERDEEKTLPGEGKRKEEMNDDERTDRGLALLLKAFERGLMKDVEEGEEKDKRDEEVKVNPAT